MMKANSMVEWTERNRNNRFVNPPLLSWQSEISGAVHRAQLGLMAGKQAGRRILYVLLFALSNQGTASLQQY